MIHYLFMICLCILSSCSTAVNTSSEPVQPKDREVHDTTNFNVDEIGQDNSALLNNTEGEFFNLFFKNRLNGFNFINKRVLFLQGIDGSHIVDKQTIFANGLKKSIKENNIPLSVSWQFLVLPQKSEEKLEYDVVITAGMKKRITVNHVLKILRKLHNARDLNI